jgi:prophage regulatory protein
MPTDKLTILRRREVQARTGLPASSLYALIKSGSFPAPIKLGGPRRCGWIRVEVEAWLEARIAETRGERE